MAAPKLNLINQFGEVSLNPQSGNATFPQWGLVLVFNGAPVDGTSGTGAGFAPKGTILVRQDSGAMYQNTNTLASPTWTAITTSSAIAAALTGFSAGAGTVAASDTVLQGFNKLAGNTQNRAVTANLLTGLAVGANSTILATDTVLEALAKLQAQIDAL